jgi:hypothetical protein
MFVCPKKLLKTCLERDQDINLVSAKEKNIELDAIDTARNPVIKSV